MRFGDYSPFKVKPVKETKEQLETGARRMRRELVPGQVGRDRSLQGDFVGISWDFCFFPPSNVASQIVYKQYSIHIIRISFEAHG